MFPPPQQFALSRNDRRQLNARIASIQNIFENSPYKHIRTPSSLSGVRDVKLVLEGVEGCYTPQPNTEVEHLRSPT